MSVQSCGSGFIAQCPEQACDWHAYSNSKAVAQEFLQVHECEEGVV